MVKKSKIIWIALILIGFAATLVAGEYPPSPSLYYLFAYFKDKEAKEPVGKKSRWGGAGVRFAWSADGFQWKKVAGGRRFFTPTVSRMVRDPFIAQGPDGVFHLVWTTGWEDRGIGYAASSDLIHWQNERILPVMAHEPNVMNCWAPEIFYDHATGQFLIFWSSTVPGRFPETTGAGDNGYNHRIYSTATADFKTLAPPQLLYDPGFICIDADLVKTGDRYIMFLKNETLHPPAKFIVLAVSDHAQGPYGPASERLSPAGVWAEGPSAIQIRGEWLVYFDEYVIHQYGVIASKDLRHWEDRSARLHLPRGARHGNIFAVSSEILRKMKIGARH